VGTIAVGDAVGMIGVGVGTTGVWVGITGVGLCEGIELGIGVGIALGEALGVTTTTEVGAALHSEQEELPQPAAASAANINRQAGANAHNLACVSISPIRSCRRPRCRDVISPGFLTRPS
jgi:hypothetical protein